MLRDRFTTEPITRMSDDALDALIARTDIGIARKAMTLAHQSRAAMADGDIEAAARIEVMAANLATVS